MKIEFVSVCIFKYSDVILRNLQIQHENGLKMEMTGLEKHYFFSKFGYFIQFWTMMSVSYLDPYQTSKMNVFANYFHKIFVLDIWQGYEYASGYCYFDICFDILSMCLFDWYFGIKRFLKHKCLPKICSHLVWKEAVNI